MLALSSAKGESVLDAVLAFLFYVPSFTIGFVVGGITGYFGNWLWYRFGPQRKKPHFTMTSEDGRTTPVRLLPKWEQWVA